MTLVTLGHLPRSPRQATTPPWYPTRPHSHQWDERGPESFPSPWTAVGTWALRATLGLARMTSTAARSPSMP